MATFACVVDGTVTQVLSVDDSVLKGQSFPDSQNVGDTFLRGLGFTGQFLQVFTDGSQHGAYPGIGWTYDEATDTFISPEPAEPVTE